MALSIGSVAHAHEMWAWGVTTTVVYEWAKKFCDPIKVKIKVVRWAQLYGCCKPLYLTQQASDNGELWNAGDFVGCIWLKVCNNFPNLRVDGELQAVTQTGGDPVIKVKKWYLSIVYAPGKGTTTVGSKQVPDTHPQPEWNQATEGALPGGFGPWDLGANTTELVEDVHLTGQLGWISLCARATGVDPQSAEFFPDDPWANVAHAATIYLTFYPNDPPGKSDYYLHAIGPGGAYPTDDINIPDVIWEPLTGGGGGIP
jgi:hypothetical protein